MSEEYKVHKAWIEEADFEILILAVPEEELEDKLAYLARDKGQIQKGFYEDFVISTFVANINQLLFHVKTLGQVDLKKVRDGVIAETLKVNPLIAPENIVLNRNFVLKVKKDEELKEDERALTDNKVWDTPYYDDYGSDSYAAMSTPEEEEDDGPSKTGPASDKKIDDLDSEIVKKWWKRINKYIQIKKFKEEDMKNILNQRFFHNRSSFQTYIVTVCVEEHEDLFITLDDMGITSRVTPPTLMREIYELCQDANPFLTYENAQELIDNIDDENNDGGHPGYGKPNRMASHAKQQGENKKKNKKRFKDVPKKELLKLADTMKVFVVGQDSAIDQITEAVQRASVGLKDPVKPIGSFLFAGRTGIGKTLTTKVLADELIKDRNNLVTIDCSEYSADHEYAKLIGAPSGYVGHESGGILTNAVLENPFSVVVFDEIEKASSKITELMLQILEEGRLTDGRGQKVHFKDTVIVMTSNIGVTEVEEVKKTIGFGDVAQLTETKKTKAIDDAIKKKFKPEFLNRIDSIVHFNSLSKKDYMRIIDLELEKLSENLKDNDTEFKTLKLEFDEKIKKFIFKSGVDDDYGARPLKRTIEKEISTPLATKLLKGDIKPTAIVKVSFNRNKVAFKAKEKQVEEKQEEMAVAEV